MKRALLLLVLLATACKERPAAEQASPAPKPSASAAASVAVVAKPSASAVVAGVPLASFDLAATDKLTKRLATLGYTPIMGCSESKMDGGLATVCVYGLHTVSLSFVDKPLKPNDKGFTDGTYSFPNAVKVTDGPSLVISAGFNGKQEDAAAILKVLWDEKQKTVAGTPLRSMKKLGDLSAPLKTKGFASSPFGGIDFALTQLVVETSHDRKEEPKGTFYKEASGDFVKVAVSVVEGTAPAGEEKRVLDALLAPPK